MNVKSAFRGLIREQCLLSVPGMEAHGDMDNAFKTKKRRKDLYGHAYINYHWHTV